MNEFMNNQGMNVATLAGQAVTSAAQEVQTVQVPFANVDAVQSVPEQHYTLRRLCARDIFPFAKILSKVGIKQFSECFQLDENDNLSLSMSGLAVALNVIDILLNNLDKCENEIYSFLAGVSSMTPEQIMNLDMDVFAQMIIEIFQKKEFADFFKAVSRLLGLEH